MNQGSDNREGAILMLESLGGWGSNFWASELVL